MTNPTPDNPLSAAAEEALFQRLLRRLADAGQVVVAGAENAAETVAGVAGSAASSVRSVAGTVGGAASDAAGHIAEHARDAADFVQRYPGVLALGAIGPAAPVALLAITALTAKKIVENRRTGEEPVAQLLFRVPESLRDEVKRLAVDEKRQMDELLTEGVLDLLIKYGRAPKLLQKPDAQPG